MPKAELLQGWSERGCYKRNATGGPTTDAKKASALPMNRPRVQANCPISRARPASLFVCGVWGWGALAPVSAFAARPVKPGKSAASALF